MLASPRRQEILRLVWSSELSAGAIHRAMPDVTFGAVSLQLRELARARLVTMRSEGRNRYYRADLNALSDVRTLLEQLWDDALWKLKLAAELEQSRRGPRPRRSHARKVSRAESHRRSKSSRRRETLNKASNNDASI